MRILESQNAVLSNVEVLDFLQTRKISLSRERPPRRRGAPNLETLIREVRDRVGNTIAATSANASSS
jgi:hypothetical protein